QGASAEPAMAVDCPDQKALNPDDYSGSETALVAAELHGYHQDGDQYTDGSQEQFEMLRQDGTDAMQTKATHRCVESGKRPRRNGARLYGGHLLLVGRPCRVQCPYTKTPHGMPRGALSRGFGALRRPAG